MSHITPSSGGHLTPEPVAGPGHITMPPLASLASPKRAEWLSEIELRGKVTFPDYTGERVYMQPFLKADGEILLPSKLARWIPTVAAMLEGIETKCIMYLMIDQSPVKKGETQRRAGPHIDGNWFEKGSGKFDPSELLILASDVSACVAYLGHYDPWGMRPGGDCSVMDLRHLDRTLLLANHVWVGNVATIHESVPVKRDCNRTLVRINVPVT